jgi:hypothetical protein
MMPVTIINSAPIINLMSFIKNMNSQMTMLMICCSVLNAQSTVSDGPKVQFLPLAEVEEVKEENKE